VAKPPAVDLVLWRLEYADDGTFGVLQAPGFLLVTVERPWRDNRRRVSCIPAGRYAVRLGTYKGRYPDLELQGVPGRDAIEIHRANLARELHGCIGVGTAFGRVHGERGVLHSCNALSLLMVSMGGLELGNIIIKDWRL
jgi:hypothetical protein